MTRSASTVDRVAALAFGLLLIVLGLGLLVWNTDWLPGIPQMVTAPGLATASETAWWPWALAGAGVVSVLVALRWLLIHTPKATIKGLRLPGGGNGTVTADLSAVASAAADVLAASGDIDKAKGRAVVDRGTRTILLDVTAYSAAVLTELSQPIDAVGSQIAGVVGDSRIATRTTIHVGKRSRRGHRVK
jgi:hypothetical protein